jgi:hypothetical protein
MNRASGSLDLGFLFLGAEAPGYFQVPLRGRGPWLFCPSSPRRISFPRAIQNRSGPG